MEAHLRAIPSGCQPSQNGADSSEVEIREADHTGTPSSLIWRAGAANTAGALGAIPDDHAQTPRAGYSVAMPGNSKIQPQRSSARRVVVVEYSRHEVVEMLRKAGLRELADEALRHLPDPVELEYAQEWGMQHGITRGALVSLMGRQPVTGHHAR